MNICTHERPPRSRLGVNMNGKNNCFTWEKDYFCDECKWYVGYWSRLVLR
jgi:hypothetical protein